MNTLDPTNILRKSINTYANEFNKHQEQFKAHLAGKIDENHHSLPPVFFPPASYWTPDEKDLFFRGLAINSRLQPDLIAEHIKTKSTFDVCMYLEALAAGLARAEDEGLVEPLSWRDTEPAMEVSERWIGREEDIAASLIHLDACPWNAEVFLEEGGASKRPEGCTCLGRKQESTSDFEEDEDDDDDEDAEEWGPVKKKEVYLSHLDSTGLMMLESIFRDAQAEFSHNSDNGPVQPEKTQPAPLKGGTEAHVDTPEPDDGDGPRSAEFNTPMSAAPSTPISEPGSPEPSEDAQKEPADKEGRRKLLNRLYMRRKRAEATGRAIISDLGKLRPGRQKKLRKLPKPRPASYRPRKKITRGKAVPSAARASPSPTSSEDSADEDLDKPDEGIEPDLDIEDAGGDAHVAEAESMYEEARKGGTKRPAKVKALFSDNGVSAETISELDLDFFHLSTLARLLRLFNSINDPTRPLNNISVSVECIHLLFTITKEFVSDVVHRAIICKEQEVRLKSGIKVWKYGQEEISVDNMKECLSTMGLPRFSKEAYTAERFDLDDLDGGASLYQRKFADDRNAMDLADDTAATAIRHHDETAIQNSYVSNLLYCDILNSSEDVIPAVSDAIAELRKEVRAEKALEKHDKALFREYEAMLWKEHR